MSAEKMRYARVERKIKIQKRLLLEQILKMPNLEIACKKINISRATVYRWRNQDKKFDAEYEETLERGTETTDDFVEAKLFELINRSDSNAILFYLKHRHRRYSPVVSALKEKKLLELKNQKTKLTPEERDRIDRVTKSINDFQNSFSNVGLIAHEEKIEKPTTIDPIVPIDPLDQDIISSE